jgi:putative ABC transport system permease protein
MKKEIFSIALRNVIKNKRRSGLNMMTFAISVFIILLGLGMVKGQFDALYERMIDLRTGHIKIYNKAYPEAKATLPLDLVIDDPDSVIAAIKDAPHLKAASARIIHNAMISNSKKKYGVLMYGIDIDKEKKILTAYDSINGKLLPENGPFILTGKKLSEMLDLKAGSQVLLFSQTSGNMNNLIDASVTATYSLGFEAMEKVNVYVPLKFAMNFLDMNNKATEIIIRVDKTSDVPQAKKYIKDILDKKFPELVVLDWKDENADLFALAKAKMGSFSVFIVIFLFLSFFIIVNTMTMSVLERTAEIGTLRAIGFDRKSIHSMYLLEGFLLAVFGVILGWIISAPVIYYLNYHGLVMDIMKSASTNNLPMTSILKSSNTLFDWILSAVICMVAGVLGAYFPAKMAADTNIVNALKRGVR